MNFQYLLKIRDIKNVPWVERVDFYFQTLCFASVPILMLFSSRPGEWILSILVAQFFLGVWQMISSFFSFVVRGPAYKKKLRHLAIACVYLLLFFVVVTLKAKNVFPEGELELSEVIGLVLFFGPPWVLAIYYYSITWRLAYPRHKKPSNFLPHINF